jgi:IS5 family transposase
MVFGFKLHALTDAQGLFKKWAFAPANHSDVTLAGELLEGLEDELVLGDKAYIGSTVCTPKRKNMAQESNWQRWMSRARKRIESTFSSLVRSLTLHAAQVKTFASLKTRVNLKIAAFNLLRSGVLFR